MFWQWLKQLFSRPAIVQPIPAVSPTKPPAPVVVLPVSADPIPWHTKLLSVLGMYELLPSGQVNPLVTEMFTHTTYPTKLNEAWCAAAECWALELTGYKSTHDASAISFKDYGTPSEYKKGAIVVIEHPSGGHHVTQFVDWADDKKKLARCLGGNQSDHVKYSIFDFNVDKPIACRWPVKA